MVKRAKSKLSHFKRIFTISIFAIAIISFYVTAMGLNSFSFEEAPWLGFLAAFAVQVCMVALIMKLPGLKQLSVRTFFLWIIYFTMLAISTWFAYVHVANYAYRNTRPIDTQSIAERITGQIISDARSYVFDSRNDARTIVEENLHQLQGRLAVHNFTAHYVAINTPPPGLHRDSGISQHIPVVLPYNLATHDLFRPRHNEYYNARQRAYAFLNTLHTLEDELGVLTGEDANNLNVQRRLSRTRSSLERLQDEITTVEGLISQLQSDMIEHWHSNTSDSWRNFVAHPLIRSYIDHEIVAFTTITNEASIIATWLGEIDSFNESVAEPLWHHFDVLLGHMATHQEDLDGQYEFRTTLLSNVDFFIRNQIMEEDSSPLLPQTFRDNLDTFIELNYIYLSLESHRLAMSEINYNVELGTDGYYQFREDWRELLNNLSSTINRMPSSGDVYLPTTDQYDVYGINNIRPINSNSFNIHDSSSQLLRLYRRRFTDINEMERAALHFVQEPRFTAIASMIFAIFLDVAPLGMGFAINAEDGKDGRSKRWSWGWPWKRLRSEDDNAKED